MTDRDPSEQIDRLAEAFVSSWRRGDRPSVADYADRHPDLAEDIRELFPLLTTMEDLKQEVDSATPLDTQLGDYRLVREIGRGGMGVVYEAVQETLGRRVALKVLPAHTTRDPRYLERFRMEAQAAGRLQHPNIVPVIGYGEHDGIHYYTMQYVEGRGVDALLVEARSKDRTSGSGSARFERAARVILAAAEGVAAAHAHGVLHRDVKPSNLMLDDEGKVWITDFGLCKEVGSDDLTHSGDLLGTLRYMPPERLQGESDVQGDVYGLGVTLYEMLTLTPAFGDEDRVKLFARIAKEEPKRPRALDARIPADLEAIVLKAIARERKRRYATADALASDLRAFLEGRPIAARPPTLGYHVRSAIRRHKPLAVTASLAVIALLASSVFYVLRVREKEADERFQNYVSHIAAAEAALGTSNEDSARRLLAAAPAEFRNWEWHHLQLRLDESLRSVPLDAPAHGIAYSPDGRWIAVGTEREARILRNDDTTERGRLSVGAFATMVRWSPTGDIIAVATTRGVELWSWPGMTRLRRLSETDHVSHVEFSADGRLLACGGHEGVLRVWSLAEDAPSVELQTRSQIHSLDFHPDGRRVVTGTWDGHVAVWSLESRRRLWSRKAAKLGSHGVCCIGTDLIATASQAAHTTVWSVEDGSIVRVLSRNRQGQAHTVFASPDGRFLLVGAGHSVHVWSTVDWQHVARRPIGSSINDIAVHPKGTRFAVASPLGRIAECALGVGDHHALLGHMDDVPACAWAPNGAYFVTGGIGGVVRLWDVRTREQVRTWIGHQWTVLALDVSADAGTVVAGDAMGEVLLWRTATDEVAHRLDAHEGPVHDVACFPEGDRLASVGLDGHLCLWDGRTGARLGRLRVSDGALESVLILPGGARLITGDAVGVLRVHEAGSLRVVRELRKHTAGVPGLAFHPERGLLASASRDQTVGLWNLAEGRVIRTLRTQSARATIYQLTAVSFSRDGSRLAASSKDGTVRLFDTDAGQLVASLRGHVAWIYDLEFSPDGTELLSVSGAAGVRVWDTRPPGTRFVRSEEEAALRARAQDVVEESGGPDGDLTAAIRAIKPRKDLTPALREEALRAAYRHLGSEDGLVRWLWRLVQRTDLKRPQGRIGRGLASGMTRAAGHRNRQDSRRMTLWGALTCRSADYELAVERLRDARRLNEDREPRLFAVDLAFLAMAHAGLEQRSDAQAALAELEALVGETPALLTPHLQQFVDEARAAVAATPAAAPK